MTSLAVFTRDLRVHDNPMLVAAGSEAVPVFVSDPDIEARHGSPNRQAFLSEALIDLDRSLKRAGSRLVHRRGAWADVVLDLADDLDAEEIHLARDVSAFSARRSAALRERSPVPVVEHDGVTVVPPGSLATEAGTPYKVFTPYYRRWLVAPRRPVCDAPRDLAYPTVDPLDLPEPGSVVTSWMRERGGETLAVDTLDAWVAEASSYDDARQCPSMATSRLSAALHFGTISPLAVERTATEIGADAFVRQLAWRDFNHQALFHHPTWATHDTAAPRRDWLDDPDAFEAWTTGMTGYPLVDAGMRQLLAEGWMHNRVRMVTASFLTKHLLIDWRRGARWFLTWLTDGDVANNQLNWQWIAGTGLDSNPHRMFNPTLQSRRHDPDGDYLRTWLPELSRVPTEEIHAPSRVTRLAVGYPPPIIEHREAVARYRGAP